MIVLKNNDKYF